MDDMTKSESKIGGNGSMQETAQAAASSAMQQATDAIERLRGVVEQATTTFRDLSQSGGEWAQQAQVRARDMANQMRDQGEWAVGTMSRQVEQYPMTSIVMALGVGFMLGMAVRRWQ